MNNFYRYSAQTDAFNKKAAFFKAISQQPPFELPPREMEEGYLIGYGVNRRPVAIRNLCEHVLVCGGTGAGKTVFLASFVTRNDGRIKFLIQDRVKNDYRNLIRHLPNVRVHSYPLRTFRDNFLQPPSGMSDHDWDSIFCDVFSQQLQMVSGAGTSQYLYRFIRELKKLVHPRIPSLLDLFEFIKTRLERPFSENYKYQERIINRLAALIEDYGDVVDCAEGYKCEDLQDERYTDVIELPLKSDSASLASDVLIFKNLKYRMKLPADQRPIPLCFLIDEAKCVFGAEKAHVRYTGSMDNLSILISTSREFGVSFILSDQTSSLHPTVFEICSSQALFRANAEITLRMSKSLGLSREQIDWLHTEGLAVGQFIFKTPGFPSVLVNAPFFEFRKNVSDEEIRF